MENNNFGKNMDWVFRERLSNHEVSPNSYNWSVIESKLYQDIRKKGPSPFLYSKFAAVLLAAICFSVFATSHYVNSKVDANENDLASFVSNEDAFWSYLERITQSPAVITKEVPVVKEVTKYEYVYNEDFYKMPSEYKYQPANGEALLSYNDIKRLLASYGAEENEYYIPSNEDEYERSTSSEIASIDKIVNYFHDAEASSPIPFIILEDSETLTQKGINSILTQKLVKRTGLHFGFGGAALNTWVLNNQPTELQNNSVMYPTTLGYQYGGNIGFDFGSKFGVEMGLYKANQGQKIAQIINLKEVQTQIRMNYLHLPLTFKYKWEQYSNLTNNSVILNYIFGLQYSRLQGFESNVNESIISKNSIQRDHDLGFVIGLEYDVFLTKNYYFTIGAKSTYAYDFDEVINVFNESSTSKANNFTVGINASINYLIPNK